MPPSETATALLLAANSKKIPQDDWLCYWNADLNVPFSLLLPSLRSHVNRLAGNKAKGVTKQRLKLTIRRGEKKIAACIADQLIIDSPSLMSRLPPGSYEAVLLKCAPIPPQARRHLVDCDLWKAA